MVTKRAAHTRSKNQLIIAKRVFQKHGGKTVKKVDTDARLGRRIGRELTLLSHPSDFPRGTRRASSFRSTSLLVCVHSTPELQSTNLVFVHHPEDLGHSLLWCIFILGELDHRSDLYAAQPTGVSNPPFPQLKQDHSERSPYSAYHLIDSLDNLQHLVVTNLAIAVDIIELESPVELILEGATGGDAQRDNEFLEVDRSRAIRIEHVKHIVGERGRISEREELLVDLLELRLVQ